MALAEVFAPEGRYEARRLEEFPSFAEVDIRYLSSSSSSSRPKKVRMSAETFSDRVHRKLDRAIAFAVIASAFVGAALLFDSDAASFFGALSIVACLHSINSWIAAANVERRARTS